MFGFPILLTAVNPKRKGYQNSHLLYLM